MSQGLVVWYSSPVQPIEALLSLLGVVRKLLEYMRCPNQAEVVEASHCGRKLGLA